VVRVLGYRSGGPGSIPGTTRKKIVDLERGPLSLVSATKELLDRKVAAPVWETENTAVGIRHADHVAPLSAKVGNHFADKRRSFGRYTRSSIADSDHGVLSLMPYYEGMNVFENFLKIVRPLRREGIHSTSAFCASCIRTRGSVERPVTHKHYSSSINVWRSAGRQASSLLLIKHSDSLITT
jgi:hypothetical protein